MKAKALLTTLFAFSFSLAAQAQEELNSALVFETYEWDFGQINEADGVVQHTFRFVNISKDPIQIDNVSTSCGCTTVLYSTQPVAGGEYHLRLTRHAPKAEYCVKSRYSPRTAATTPAL